MSAHINYRTLRIEAVLMQQSEGVRPRPRSRPAGTSTGRRLNRPRNERTIDWFCRKAFFAIVVRTITTYPSLLSRIDEQVCWCENWRFHVAPSLLAYYGIMAPVRPQSRSGGRFGLQGSVEDGVVRAIVSILDCA
uniref:Uncharacterized protein n=1 Tax=Plectus sambesii TaxID=2011161 RepID=A0A914WVS1_9BILA